MAGSKGMMFKFSFVLVAFYFTSSLSLTKEEEDLTLQSIMSRAAEQMDPKGRKPDWTKHPLFPLYEIDVPVCKDSPLEKNSGACDSWKRSGYCRRYSVKRACPKTCGFCKSAAAPACQRSRFGCCWDKLSKARGPNGEGCQPCLDLLQKTCPQFKSYCTRKGTSAMFIRYHCFDTCGICGLSGSSIGK